MTIKENAKRIVADAMPLDFTRPDDVLRDAIAQDLGLTRTKDTNKLFIWIFSEIQKSRMTAGREERLARLRTQGYNPDECCLECLEPKASKLAAYC